MLQFRKKSATYPENFRRTPWQERLFYYFLYILVTLQVNVALNHASLAGLLATMRQRRMNHQDAARALILETQPHLSPIFAPSRYYDPDENWA